jgi:hypothetical protein
MTITDKITLPAEFPMPVPPASPRRAGPGRYTLDGDRDLESHLELTCARIVSAIRGLVPGRKLESVLLGGGYGRGEGGVLAGPDGHHPYNDLEFYVAIRGNRHLNEVLYHRRLEVMAEILTHLAGVEVEFKITSLAEMAAKPVSMFSYDLASGHRVLWPHESPGTEAFAARHASAADIPLSEATRLLMNRCSGLLLAREKLDKGTLTAADADFVRRNIAKAQLACGDALLVAQGLYHWSCRRRHRRLKALAGYTEDPFLDDVLRSHASGVQFKLHPETTAEPREILELRWQEARDQARQCWLRIESRRLGRSFASIRDYLDAPCGKGPESPAVMNLVLNARASGRRFRLSGSLSRHPRERVFNSLALLLWAPDEIPEDERQCLLERELGQRPRSPDGWVDAYRALWGRAR